MKTHNDPELDALLQSITEDETEETSLLYPFLAALCLLALLMLLNFWMHSHRNKALQRQRACAEQCYLFNSKPLKTL